MKYTPRWKQIIFAILHPNTWLRGYNSYCKELDIEVQELLLSNDMTVRIFADNSPSVATFDNGVKLWVHSYPYGSGRRYSEYFKWYDILPSRHTCYLLNEAVLKKLRDEA